MSEGVQSPAPPAPAIQVSPSPHIGNTGLTTRRMMLDVVIALVPAISIACFLFQWHAIAVLGLSVLSCLAAEALFTKMRGKALHLDDGSALVTGLILGLSLPWSAPPHVVAIAAFAAIGLGKMAFGGLGMNLFNPAMVGRAFVTLSFAQHMGGSAYVAGEAEWSALTQATPLTAARLEGVQTDWSELFLGLVNGSLGEVSALALILGGLYLCIRRAAAWEVPVGVLLGAAVAAFIAYLAGAHPFDPAGQLLSGSLLFGAFFIATDPCSSPVTRRGRWIFGIGIGLLAIFLRSFSSYPEGVMFAVLLMNAAVPLLNRWTIPSPLGGRTPTQPAKP